MPSSYQSTPYIFDLSNDIRRRKWLVTGAAGFIGSHLTEALLSCGATVRGVDNLCSGNRENLEQVRSAVGETAWSNFEFLEEDIRSSDACRRACAGVDVVLHQAALGSVTQSLETPDLSNEVNVGGFVNILQAARAERVTRVVYASSCAIYGDAPQLPKEETLLPAPITPYALTKIINEQYADIFAKCFSLQSIGLRYFNIYGPRQDPRGAYAAVIPLWMTKLIESQTVKINGDGENTRDFCHVSDVVQANIRAAVVTRPEAVNRVFNVASGQSVTLNQLLRAMAAALNIDLSSARIENVDFRPGDIRHSSADISSAKILLGFAPNKDIERGLAQTADGYRPAGKSPKP